MTDLKCQFCHKTKDGYRCLLYNKDLSNTGKTIDKLQECCRVTAGFKDPIISTPPQQEPTVNPKFIMKQTIKQYKEAVNDLLNQGYPQRMAEAVAQKIVLGE